MESAQGGQRAPTRKRLSRKGLPRRFTCEHFGCNKQYSRAEHLQRHSLNHEPKQIYRCPSEDCCQTFVRQDLFDRHVEKHRHTQSLPQPSNEPMPTQDECEAIVDQMQEVTGLYPDATTSAPLRQSTDAALLGDSTAPAPTDWGFATQPFEDATLDSAQYGDGFAAWLLSPPGSHGWDLDIAQLPPMEHGSYTDIYCSSDKDNPTPLPAVGGYDNPTASVSSPHRRESHVHLSIRRLSKLHDLLQSFYNKYAANLKILTVPAGSLVCRSPEGLWLNVTTTVLELCIKAFWLEVASQIPIVHRATFSAEHAPLPLLLAIVSLGAAQLVRSNAPSTMADYRNLADLIITGLRWEIHANEDAQPPVNLWVAQSLLLLEFYEKMFSSRQLHERAHIHHVSTLTLLQRGSPLGGRSGAETPLEAPSTPQSPNHGDRIEMDHSLDSDTWWRRWANNEAMIRVVFMAYEMDTLHAAMFGHESSLLPSDVGLTLPCDDILWTADNADSVRELETTFSLYGIKPTKFLDGLKEYLHGDSPQLHIRARLTLVVGLLSVGCHIRPREKHNKLFESVPSQAERKRWTTMMLEALDQWKHGIDSALNTASFRNVRPSHSSLTTEPTVLYHLAYITIHIDILKCQILAGTQLLLGRRVSRKELVSATSYATSWASTPDARLAVSHSFKLLSHTLIGSRTDQPRRVAHSPPLTQYFSRSDSCIYRPWCLYLAALTIWTYQYVISCEKPNDAATDPATGSGTEEIAHIYLWDLAECDDPDQLIDRTSHRGCSAVLQTVSDNLATAEPTILIEASRRLLECRSLLESRSQPHHS